MRVCGTSINPDTSVSRHAPQQPKRKSECAGMGDHVGARIKRRRAKAGRDARRRVCRRQSCPILLFNRTKSHRIVPRLSLKTLQLTKVVKYTLRFWGNERIAKLVSGEYTTEHNCISCGADVLYKRLPKNKEHDFTYVAIFLRNVKVAGRDGIDNYNNIEKAANSLSGAIYLQQKSQWHLALVNQLGLRYLSKDVLMLGTTSSNRCLTEARELISQTWLLSSQQCANNGIIQLDPSYISKSDKHLYCEIKPLVSTSKMSEIVVKDVDDALFHEHVNAIGITFFIGAHKFILIYPVCRFLHAIYLSLCTPCRQINEYISCSPPVDRRWRIMLTHKNRFV